MGFDPYPIGRVVFGTSGFSKTQRSSCRVSLERPAKRGAPFAATKRQAPPRCFGLQAKNKASLMTTPEKGHPLPQTKKPDPESAPFPSCWHLPPKMGHNDPEKLLPCPPFWTPPQRVGSFNDARGGAPVAAQRGALLQRRRPTDGGGAL